MKPEFQWPRRRRAPALASGAVHLRKKWGWINESMTLECEPKPKYFVVWKFTQNQTVQVRTRLMVYHSLMDRNHRKKFAFSKLFEHKV